MKEGRRRWGGRKSDDCIITPSYYSSDGFILLFLRQYMIKQVFVVMAELLGKRYILGQIATQRAPERLPHFISGAFSQSLCRYRPLIPAVQPTGRHPATQGP